MKQFLTIKDMPESERPYEKFQKYGPGALSDAELLAVIIKTGTKTMRSIDVAANILKLGEAQGGLSHICTLSLQELKKIKGIGTVKAIQILCVVELSKRIAKSTKGDQLIFDCPELIASYYMEELRHLKQEHLVLMLLDTKNHLIRDLVISKGTVNSAIMNPREIFIEALRYEAVNIVIVHNHPSGDPTPSSADIHMTKQIAAAGEMLNIHLLDHIIIGDNCYETLAGFIE